MKIRVAIFIEVDLNKAKQLGSKATDVEAKEGMVKMAKEFCDEFISPPDDQYITTYYEITEIE